MNSGPKNIVHCIQLPHILKVIYGVERGNGNRTSGHTTINYRDEMKRISLVLNKKSWIQTFQATIFF